MSKGTRFVVLAIKEIVNCLDRFYGGCPLKKGDTTYVSLNNFGIPKCLGLLINVIKNRDDNYLRHIRSILTINRSIRLELKPDYGTITSPSTQSMEVPDYIYKKFVKKLRLSDKLREIPKFNSFHYSNKSSPLGPYTHKNCILELLCLDNDLLDNIYLVGGEVLKSRMIFLLSHTNRVIPTIDILPDFDFVLNSLKKQFPKDFKTKSNRDIVLDNDSAKIHFLRRYLRKIVTFSEFEGKTRIIAMIDY